MKNEKDWKEYASKTLPRFISSLSKDEVNWDELESVSIEAICRMSQKEAYDALRKCLTGKQVTKYQNNFRQHQYRKKNDTTTLPLKASSLKRLQDFQNRVGADSIDEAIEFLLSPEYEDYRTDVEVAKYMMAKQSFDRKDTFFKALFRWLPQYELGRIELIIESVFRDGWKKAKASRKKTGNPIKEALEENEIKKELATWLTQKND
jgi:hypothetical protein